MLHIMINRIYIAELVILETMVSMELRVMVRRVLMIHSVMMTTSWDWKILNILI